MITNINKKIVMKNTAMKNVLKSAITTAALYSMINVAQASAMLVEVNQYYHELPKAVSEVCNKKDNCPEIEVSYLNSSQTWVNELINQNINAMIAGESVYPLVRFEDYEVKIPASVKHTLDGFAKSQIEDMPADTSLAYSKMIKPTYLGHTGSLELFDISGYDYLGGAHGMGFVSYSILDGDTKKEIRLDDMLLTDTRPVLAKLVEAEFDKWLIKNDLSPNEHKQTWEFSLTDNVTFTPEGLKFLYQPYAIAFYAAGMPELTVSYDTLDGIIQPKYLQAGKQLAN